MAQGIRLPAAVINWGPVVGGRRRPGLGGQFLKHVSVAEGIRLSTHWHRRPGSALEWLGCVPVRPGRIPGDRSISY